VCEKYLVSDTNRAGRIEMTKLRISAHQLRVEVGRYGRDRIEDRSERRCLYCLDGVEDEYHYLFQCHRLKAQRFSFYEKVEILTNGKLNLSSPYITRARKLDYLLGKGYNADGKYQEFLKLVQEYLVALKRTRTALSVKSQI